MPSRGSVYDAIDSECDYRNNRLGRVLKYPMFSGSSGMRIWPSGEAHGDRTLDEFALYIAVCTRDLEDLAAHTVDPRTKLETVRQIAALCVACMEQHGAPRRE